MKYAAAIEKKLKNKNVRVSIDDRNEKLNYKIREAQTKKVPYTIVIGNKEAESKNVTYRLYGHMDSKTVAENEFVKIIEKDIKERQVTRNY
jgi:threonyl-tRNA synthetase